MRSSPPEVVFTASQSELEDLFKLGATVASGSISSAGGAWAARVFLFKRTQDVYYRMLRESTEASEQDKFAKFKEMYARCRNEYPGLYRELAPPTPPKVPKTKKRPREDHDFDYGDGSDGEDSGGAGSGRSASVEGDEFGDDDLYRDVSESEDQFDVEVLDAEVFSIYETLTHFFMQVSGDEVASRTKSNGKQRPQKRAKATEACNLYFHKELISSHNSRFPTHFAGRTSLGCCA